MSAPTRRALLAGAGAAMALPAATPMAAHGASVVPWMPDTPPEMLRLLTRDIEAMSADPHPDAELIRICAEHIANRTAANADESNLEPEDNPLWRAYCRTWDAIEAAKPQTMGGVLAKARAAAEEGSVLDEDGLPSDPKAAAWAWHLVNDLLRLYEKA